jgi:hypothetical protein
MLCLYFSACEKINIIVLEGRGYACAAGGAGRYNFSLLRRCRTTLSYVITGLR